MNKRILIIIILVLVLVLGVVAAVYLLRQDQDIRESASVPGGTSTVTISPTEATLSQNEPTRVSVLFNTGGVSISGVAIKLNYRYSEASTPVDVQNIAVSSGLLGTGDWNCPVTQFNASAGTATIDVSCFVTSTTGYSSEVDTQLFTFDMIAGTVPEFNPVEVSFDPSESVIATKDTGEDVLLIPESTGTYLVRTTGAGGGAGATAAPGLNVGTTGTPTATPTGLATSTPTGTASATPVSTLPEAGISAPTLMGVGVGAALIFGALLLAI